LHRPIAEAEAAKSYTFFESVVAAAPKPRHPILLDWLRHVKAQPEIFAFLERTMLDRNPPDFSALSLVEYCRGSIQRAAERHKRFTLKNNFASFYCKALIMKNPEFNGRCEFRGDSNGKIRPGRANRLLGTSLAPEPINGEPYRRLIWNEVSR
jgi:hypothetical protein